MFVLLRQIIHGKINKTILNGVYFFVSGYYQPAGPLIKETGAEAERALARYHPQPHYHAPHPSVSTTIIIDIQSL
jgi:hypothetical protein